MKCSRCGQPVEYVETKGGQKIAVNPGWVMFATGKKVGGVTKGRVVHWVTCQAEKDQGGPRRMAT